jgi:hypothetical protein
MVDVRKAGEHERGSVPGAVSLDAYAALNAGEERALKGLEVPQGCRRARGLSPCATAA